MVDPTLAGVLSSMPAMIFEQIMSVWWFWLGFIIIALLIKILPLVVNKKIDSEKSQERCPKCGGYLIEKRKYGRFLACSNYPKCRFTKKID